MNLVVFASDVGPAVFMTLVFTGVIVVFPLIMGLCEQNKKVKELESVVSSLYLPTNARHKLERDLMLSKLKAEHLSESIEETRKAEKQKSQPSQTGKEK